MADSFALLVLVLVATALFLRSFKATPQKSQKPSNTNKIRSSYIFRAQGVPLNLDVASLSQRIAAQLEKDESASKNAGVKGKFRKYIGSDKSVVKHDFKIISMCQDPESRSQTCVVVSKSPFTIDADPITFDENFLGLTVLFDPPTHDHEIDIVFVPGLASHPYWTWKDREGGHLWLTDSLPQDLLGGRNGDAPCARIMTYGYRSQVVNSESVQTIEDLATSLKSALSVLVSSQISARPIVLVGHSMGGIVIKETLIRLYESVSSVTRPRDKGLLNLIHGVVFMGVPQRGMHIAEMRKMAADQANRQLIESLGGDNSYLLNRQTQEFEALLNDPTLSVDTVYFYETEKSPTAVQDINGKWSMTGPSAMLVPTSSAKGGSRGAINVPIAHGHSDMVKFARYSEEYRKVGLEFRHLKERVLKYQKEEAEAKTKREHEEIKEDGRKALEECVKSLGCEGIKFHSRIERLRTRQTPGTCQWLLKNQCFLEWTSQVKESTGPQDISSNFTPKLLFITGKPGSGKSTIMQAACYAVQELRHTVLSFFVDARSKDQTFAQSEMGLYSALLIQLLGGLSDANRVSSRDIILHHKQGTEQWTSTQIRQAILAVLDTYRPGPLFIFLDAIDECIDLSFDNFIELLENISRAGIEIRLCLSSRKEISIFRTVAFHQSPVIDVGQHNRSDIHEMIEERLNSPRNTKVRVSEKVRLELCSRASNNFLWGDLITNLIQNEVARNGTELTEEDLLRFMDEIPNKLTELYDYLLGSVRASSRREVCSLIILVHVSRRPVNASEVRSFLEYSRGTENKPHDMKDVDIEARIRRVSCGLVDCQADSTGESPVVQLIHKSFGDYLKDSNSAGLGQLDAEYKHHSEAKFNKLVFEQCLRSIKHQRFGKSGTGEQHPFLAYGRQFWMAHARESGNYLNEDTRSTSFLGQCQHLDSQEIVQLFKESDHYTSYRHVVAAKDVPNFSLVRHESRLIVFLAFGGCTNLVTRHLQSCRKCNAETSVNKVGSAPLLPPGSISPVEPVRRLQPTEHYGNPQSSALDMAFFVAAYSGFVDTTEAIIRAKGSILDINALHGFKEARMTALYIACLKGNLRMVDVLLEAGANALTVCPPGYQTALNAVVVSSEAPDMLDCILRHYRSRDVNDSDTDPDPAKCRQNMTHLLAQSTAWGSALHLAVFVGQVDVLRMILQELQTECEHDTDNCGWKSGRTEIIEAELDGRKAIDLAYEFRNDLLRTPQDIRALASMEDLDTAICELGRASQSLSITMG